MTLNFAWYYNLKNKGEKMENFGYKHLTGLAWLLSIIAVLLTVLLIIRKKFNKGENFDRAVIRYTAYFMWAWEIVKTIRMVNAPDYGPIGTYPLWMAPFHLCSMGLYAFLIIGSKRAGKFAEWIKPFSFAVMLLATSLILTIPASSGIMGSTPNWSFVYDNILPYQSFLYHGCILFVPLYMVLSGFYRPRWFDIFKAISTLSVVATFAQILNFTLDGSGADFMTLRYGNGNPFAFLLQSGTPALYYIVVGAIAFGGTALVIAITIGIRAIIDKCKLSSTNTNSTSQITE